MVEQTLSNLQSRRSCNFRVPIGEIPCAVQLRLPYMKELVLVELSDLKLPLLHVVAYSLTRYGSVTFSLTLLGQNFSNEASGTASTIASKA